MYVRETALTIFPSDFLFFFPRSFCFLSIPSWLSGKKKSASQAGDVGSIPGLGRFPGEGNGNPLQYSWLENSMGRVTVHGVAKSQTQLSN